jgi:molybdenum cofactor biosynthesis enzyme MoaA
VGSLERGESMSAARASDPGLRGASLRDALSRPLRDLRISVTDRCNFRCPYCMPAEVFGEHYRFMPRAEILRFEEIERLAGLFLGLGVRKLRITGGEPLLRAELPELVARLAALDGAPDLALTTNGSLLARHAQALRDAGLGRLTVSLDSLDPEVFRRMNGAQGSVERVLEGIEAGYRGEVARRYRYRDGAGEIGFISSVTQPFCGDCTRARLTADGRLVTCLFARDGTDLKGPLRAGASDEELRELVRAVWLGRTDRYSEVRFLETDFAASPERGRIEMFRIGG